MKKHLARFILKVAGWKIADSFPDAPKAVCVMAPHTSMWDFVWGKLFFMSIGIKPKFLIKAEAFKGIGGYFLKAMGGIPVNRKNPAGLVPDILDRLKKQDEFILVITPEGTRKKVDVWKTGAIRIARAAKIPLIAGRMDYGKKELGLAAVYWQVPDDPGFINRLKLDFAKINGKHPEKFNPYAKQ